jgi:uncharacterized protein YjbI with pentapeptide repeats
MKDKIMEDQRFEDQDFSAGISLMEKYDNCLFVKCDMANADLSGITFLECTFDECDLSNAKIEQAAFRDVNFTHCKLIGLLFHDCNPFLLQMSFSDCQLDLASFYGLKLKNTRFQHCSLQETDLTEADLTATQFEHCDLYRTIFDQTILEKADLSTALRYSIDPENNRIRKARFSREGIIGLLDKYGIVVED